MKPKSTMQGIYFGMRKKFRDRWLSEGLTPAQVNQRAGYIAKKIFEKVHAKSE